MFKFIHGYLPGVWEAQVANGLVGENDGIRFCQNIMLNDNLKFNNLAAKGGELYKIIAERKCVFYIDRIQGGVYIDEYKYNQELLNEYKEMLGENFWGFQMHEWLSNYYYDVFGKLKDLPEEKWTKEEIESYIFKKYPFPYLMLESMTAQEMAEAGFPKTGQELYRNMTEIYKKRLKVGDLLPCDSAFLAYGFELSIGAKRLMPEVGAQTCDARLQICYARGMTRKKDRSFGVYYEPWGGDPFSACCYHKESKNEWGIGESSDFPFETQGPNGGSSRSLQKRIFLYGYLSGAEFISEEWGLCNVFYDWKDYKLSPYGQVKKEFLEFTRKYIDIGDKIAPIAAILPVDLMVLDNIYDDTLYCGMKTQNKKLAKLKQGVRELFTKSLPMLGSAGEINTLKNSDIPDAIDLLNFDDEIVERYDYLIDFTFNDSLKQKYKNICDVKDVKRLLKSLLPCYVEGNVHWLVNHCTSGGYYLSIFNHSGVERTVENGEKQMPEAKAIVEIFTKEQVKLTVCEGEGILSTDNDRNILVIPAGGWSFIKISLFPEIQ